LYFAVVFAVFFSHGVDESHQNAKTASHNNASNRRAHRISLKVLGLHLALVLVCLRLLALRLLWRLARLFVLAILPSQVNAGYSALVISRISLPICISGFVIVLTFAQSVHTVKTCHGCSGKKSQTVVCFGSCVYAASRYC
jgi:hypothetical protein